MPKKPNEMKVMIKANALKNLIGKMNLSLSEFAQRAKITPSSFSIHLSKRREPSPAIRRRILKEVNKIHKDIEWGDIFYIEEQSEKTEE